MVGIVPGRCGSGYPLAPSGDLAGGESVGLGACFDDVGVEGDAVDTLNWAVAAAKMCAMSFMRIEGRFGSTQVWGELYGFSDR
jgi:hypothetical protein